MHDGKDLEFIGEEFNVAKKPETESVNKSHAVGVSMGNR